MMTVVLRTPLAEASSKVSDLYSSGPEQGDETDSSGEFLYGVDSSARPAGDWPQLAVTEHVHGVSDGEVDARQRVRS